MWNEDDRKWLYDTMSRNGVDTGSYEEFAESLNNKEDRDWYYNKSLSLGLNVGSAEDFEGMMIQPQEATPQQGFFTGVKAQIADTAKQAMQKPRGGENGYTFTADELGIEESNGNAPAAPVELQYDGTKPVVPGMAKEGDIPGIDMEAYNVNMAKAMAEGKVLSPQETQRRFEEREAEVAARLPQARARMSQRMQQGQTVQGAFDRAYDNYRDNYPTIEADRLTSGLFDKYAKERENVQGKVKEIADTYHSTTKYIANPQYYSISPYTAASVTAKGMEADDLNLIEGFIEDAREEILTNDKLKAEAEENAQALGLELHKYVDEVAVPMLQERMYKEWIEPQEEEIKEDYMGIMSAFDNSIIGMLANISRTDTERYLKQVGQEEWRKNASLWKKAAAGAGSMIFDLPIFGGIGSLASKPAQALGQQVFKGLAKRETARQVAKGATKEAAQRYANYAVRNGLKNRILLNLSTAPLQSGLTFGVFDAGKTALNMSLGGEWDWSELGKSAAGGTLLGSALGVTSAVGSGLTYGLTGPAKYAGKVAEFGVENAVFTEGGRLIGKLHGQQPENGWLEDYVESGATLLMLKAPNIAKNVSRIKGDKEASEVFSFNKLEREQLGKYGEDLNAVLESLLPQSAKLYEDGLKISEGTFTEEYRRVMSDPEVSMTTKAKLMGIVEGKVMPAPRVTDVKIEGNRVMTYDPMGQLVDVREYATKTKAEAEYKKAADKAEIESIAVLEDVYMRIKGYEADELTVKEWLAKNPKVTMERVAEIVAKNSAGEKLTEAEQKILESLRQARREGLNDVRHLNDVLAGLDVDAKDVMSGLDKPIDKRTERENHAVRAYTDVLFREVKDKIQEPYRRGEAQRAADDVWRAANNVKWANEDVKLLADRIYESDRQIDETANDGMVYTTTTPSGEKIIITGGKVVLDNEGYIDVNQSEGLVAMFPDGQKKPVRPGDLREKVEVSNAEELKAAKREEIKQEVAAERIAESGEVAKNEVLTYEEGGETHSIEVLGDNGDGTSRIISDGQEKIIGNDLLESLRGAQGVVEDQIGDNAEKVVEPADEAAAPVVEAPKTALEQIPRNEKNVPLYEQVDSELAWDGVVEEAVGNEETAMIAVNSMIADKQAALKKAEKAKAKAGATITEKIAAENERVANIEKAKADLAKWEEIAGVKAKRALAAEAESKRVADEAAAKQRAEEERLRAEREEAERAEREALNGVPDMVDDKPQDARARGYRRVNGYKVDRQEPVQGLMGKEIAVKFSDSSIPTGRVAVIEAEQLQPSHIQGQRNPLHFIDEAQPKERNDAASVLSARKIAENVRPEEITSSVTAYTGAPTVNTRGEAVQGNNRSAALRLMWENNPEQAAKYKQYLMDHAAEFGLNAEEIAAMKSPVLVNMLDVSDADAITLGQYVAQDTESGGTERIKPKNVMQKMGGDMRSFANKLLASNNEEASFAELVDANGVEVLKWMAQKGYITPTQYKSAFDSKGNLTAEVKNDLRDVMYQSIFKGGSTQLEEMFNALPAKAQKAILATAFRDYDSPSAERMNGEVQNSIRAYYALARDAAFANAKNYKEAKEAAMMWARQYQLDDVSGESFLPSENFSNFAIELAVKFKGETQKTLQNLFNNIYDLIQGTKQASIFEEADNTPRTLKEAIKETLNIDYNGQYDSNSLAGGNKAGQPGRQGTAGSTATGERIEGGERPADSTGGARGNGEVKPTVSQTGDNVAEGGNAPGMKRIPTTLQEIGNVVVERANQKQEERRRVPLRTRAQEWTGKLGVPIKVHESIETVTNKTANERLKNGDILDAWFNVNTGEVEMYLPYVMDVAQVDKLYLHEVVGHKGLREVMGEKFDTLCDNVWGTMSESKREHFLDYVGAVDEFGVVLESPSQKQMRDAADEYMAWLAENVDYETNKELWQPLIDSVREFFESLGMGAAEGEKGVSPFVMSDADIVDLIKASYANLASKASVSEPVEGNSGDEVSQVTGPGETMASKKSGRNEGTMFRISKTPEEFDATQKEAVEKRGIVAPNLNNAVVSVVDVPKHDFTGSLKEARAQAEDWAVKNYTGREFDFPDNSGKYVISKKAIGKYLDKTAVEKSDNAAVHLSALKKLPEIISNSIEVELHADYKKDGQGRSGKEIERDDLLIHRLYGAINIGGNTYRVKTTVREFKDVNTPNSPHSYEVTKIELIEDSTVTPDGIDSPLNRPINSISATKLLNGVEKSYDKGKKVLAASENSSKGGTMFSKVTPEMDAEYIAAVENGDMETAERLVKEAAKLAMPETKVVDEEGYPMVVYHGSADEFTVFGKDISKKRVHTQENSYFFSKEKAVSEDYGDVLYGAYLDLRNPLVVDFEGRSWRNTREVMSVYYARNNEVLKSGFASEEEAAEWRDQFLKDDNAYSKDADYVKVGPTIEQVGPSTDEYVAKAQAEGYDGVIIENVVDAAGGGWVLDENNRYTIRKTAGAEIATTDYVAFSPNQIKSADAVTYDDNGNVIPLNERFDEEKEDIRFRKVFHGSGAKFDKFDHSFMSTGEGAQIYGWGTYVTEVEGIGKAYANSVTANRGAHIAYNGKPLLNVIDGMGHWWKVNKNRLASAGSAADLRSIIKGLRIGENANERTAERFERQRNELLAAIDNGEITVEKPRNLYTVEIPDDNGSNYLHWEKRIPMNVVNSIKKRLFDVLAEGDYKGAEKELKRELDDIFKAENNDGYLIYGNISAYLGGDKAASQFLNDMGFVGISYPAEATTGGRADGARNYVIFNENDAVIEDRTMFRFIGKKGAESLDKAEEATTRLDNLNVAREMETAGKDAKAIKLATGWERGADRKWKYETEDAKVNRAAKLYNLETRESYPIARSIEIGRVDDNSTIRLTDLVKDDELFETYPEMEEYFVSFEKMDAGIEGSHIFEEKMIRINKDDIHSLESTLVHEIQHAIQSIEGFAKGGNTSSSNGLIQEVLKTLHVDSENAAPSLSEVISAIENGYITRSQHEELVKIAQSHGYDDVVEYVRSLSPYSYYRRLAGEVESRNVEERLGMSPEERRNKLAEETEDVRREDQIFLEKNLGVSASEAKKESAEKFAVKNNANFVSTYKTKDGKDIEYTSERAEGYGIQGDGTGNSYDGTGNSILQRQTDTGVPGANSGLNADKGEFCVVERVFTENGAFNFTSGEKIESADDVAYIFSALEDAAKEHSFVVYVKDGKPTVIELGMGSFNATMVDIPTASLAYSRINPDHVYFVHNHPSGNLICSDQDVAMLRVFEDMSDVPVTGVIINLKTGKYGTFDTERHSVIGEKRVPENEERLIVHTLDKQIFAPDYDPMAQPLVRSSQDVAQFLNSQRMGDRPKVSFLILSRANRIIGNIHTPFTDITTDTEAVARYINERVIQFGGENAILYGDFAISMDESRGFRLLQGAMGRFGKTKLLDVVHVEGNFTKSAIDLGLLYEPETEYNVAKENEEIYNSPEQDIPVESVQTQPLTFAEKITNSVLEASAKNKENLALRSDALRMCGRDVANVLKLMGKQREYDKSTVDQLVKLAKMYFKDAQLLGGLTPYQVGRVMTRLNNAVGKRDITDDANELVNILVDAHNKELEKMLEKQAKTKAKKVNASGVEVIGKLDKEGQLLLEEYNAGKELDLERIDEKIIDLQNEAAEASGKLEGENGEVERETAAKIRGLELARQYREEILKKLDEIKGLEQELKSAEQDAKDGAMDRAAYKEFRRATERAILESKLEMVDAYHGLIHGLGGDISSSAKRAKLFQQQQIDHVKEIQHNANSDLSGHPAEAQGETPDKWNSSVPRLFMSAMPTFQTMLKFFGEKAADGRGYLYERFIPQHTQASHNEYVGKTEAREKMRDKLTEIFGKKTSIEDFLDMSRKDGAVLEYQEGGQKKTIDLTRGQVLYLYMINKMADGQMKLSRMGITDADVLKMAKELPEEMVRFADWVQQEFLTELREKYNKVHERMFGAPMAAIESYFPIKINKRSRGEKIEPGMNAEDKPSTVTGSVIKRTKNAVAIDLSADAMQVLLGHIDDMENWAAWAEFRRDVKSLLNYRHFQNQVKGMESLRYGSGEKLWKNFVDVANIAAGSFKPSSTAADRAVRNIAKGVVSSKIAFRYFTAVKQILSTPAFWSEVDFGKMMNAYLHQKEAWDWAMKNLPGFSKRWEGRASGNEILLESDADWKVWQNRAVQWLSNEGMRANAFIDALTVATGAKAVFETKYEMFKKAGYSEERAREKALNRAAEAYNESQQSSESAYLSPLQAEATFVSSVLTAYRNSPFGYNRKMATAIANLKKKMKKGFKQESIEYMIKQLMRDGLNEEQAKEYAKSTYRRSVARDAADVALYEFFLNYVWVLGPSLIYILGGDDDEKKKELNVEALIDGAMGGLGNLPAGETLTGAIKAIAEGDVSNFKLPQAVAMQDMETIADLMQTDPVRAAGEVLNILVAMGVGVNPQTFTDMFVALADTEDWSDPREIAMLVLRLINAPNSKLELLEADEAMENYGENIEEITREYAEYQKSKRAPLSGWLYSDESEQKAIERYEKRFKKILDERFEVVVENTDEYDMWYENSDPQMKAKLAKLRQKFLEGDKETTMEKLDSIDVTKKVLFGSGYDEVNTVYYELSTAEDEDMAMMIDTKLKELKPVYEEHKKKGKEFYELHKREIDLYGELMGWKNAANGSKRAMKDDPEQAQRYMNEIREYRTKAIDLINNYNE